ncbi:MAG TPA: YbdK family carboxylate-amine ligase [Alphaproteobacteria bacterium]|nr:YbdK family carboxylate-amine ligase [Alphaproteobacteria bacterium]
MPVIPWLKNVFESGKKIADERKLYKKIDDQLVFQKSEPLTLGVEFELAVLDKISLRPAHIGIDIIEEIKVPGVKKEAFAHMVEVTTAIAKNVQEAEAQLTECIDKIEASCEKRGVMLTGTGRPPTIMLAEVQSTADKDARYKRLVEERKVLNQRFGTLGMHIHIGMANAEECVRFHNFFMHFIPHLIALSSSSPFEDGVHTGLATIRPTIAESLPVAGMPYSFRNWQEYVGLVRAIYRAGSIQDMKDLWWDLRPAPRFGTLEIRVCDQPATMDEAMAIVSFVHCLALWFQENQDWLAEIPRPNSWRVRENKWRAMRYGLDAELVLNNQGETRPIRDDIHNWLERLMPHVEQRNYKRYIDMLEQMLEKGNSTARQDKLWGATHDIPTMARFNCEEFSAGTPQWDRVEKAVSEKKAAKPESKAVPEQTVAMQQALAAG